MAPVPIRGIALFTIARIAPKAIARIAIQSISWIARQPIPRIPHMRNRDPLLRERLYRLSQPRQAVPPAVRPSPST
jgi:hypothetical protein